MRAPPATLEMLQGFRTSRNLWPIIATIYIWCAAFFAITEFQQGVRYMAVASLKTAAMAVAILLALRVISFG